MFKKNLTMTIMGLFTPAYSMPAIAADAVGIDAPREKIKRGKGQWKDTKPKPSGAAQLKRAAKKARNIRKHN